MPDSDKSEIEKVKDQILAWNNRAEMARQVGNPALAELALEHKRRYQNKLQEFDETQ